MTIGAATRRPPAPLARLKAVSWLLFWLVVLAIGWGRGVVPLFDIWNVDADGVSPISNKRPEWDYVNMWAGGRLAAAGEIGRLFDHASYNAWLRGLFSSRMQNHDWSYPPSMLLLAVPLALPPLFWSYLTWTVGTLAALWAALRRNGLPLLVCVMTLLSPAALNNLSFGQNGALTAALLLGGLLCVERRPWLAGLLLGLLSFKPHLLLLVPVCLVAARQWSALAIAAATALAMFVASGFAFGWEAWRLFATETQPLMRGIMEAPYELAYQVNGITVFLLARAAGLGLAAAYAVQAVAAIAAAAVAWRAWRLPDADSVLRAALTVSLGLLATPYAWSFDMVAYSAAATILIARRAWRLTPLLALIWLWPGLAQTVTRNFFPVTSLLVLALAWLAWRALRSREAGAG